MAFPAKPIHTTLNWSDLVVNDQTALQLEPVRLWLQHGRTLSKDWGLSTHGYRALFYGPSGSGKTLAAALLGKEADLQVFRIDLSMVISKYIGETEKNLARLLGKAEGENWILFFDEADSLFGKRTNISDSHDRYANQDVAYLLQRLEEYEGLVIFSFTQKANIDAAFLRRFSSIVHFPVPAPPERLRLWQQAFSPASQPPPDKELARLAQTYELTGGAIHNVVRYASLKAIARQEKTISVDDLLQGISQELHNRSLEA